MNAYYRLYIKGVLKLAATLVIKSSYTASSMNDYLKTLGYTVDPDDPYSWKYYRNLAGEYHESNTMMTITSLDTQEEIQFTKANLRVHRATAREYTYGNRYYDDLVAANPDQQLLINGIINPVDIEVAILTDDHNILSYDKSLVEAGEQQLIPDLQTYIANFFHRYDNSDYGLFEPYYYPGLLAVLYSKIPLVIINSRKRACKSDAAHSYHIRQYLNSFSKAVGAEFDYLTQKQKLTLYRNIRYLNLNIGRAETFKWLTEKILTDRGFSLATYDIGQTTDKMLEDLVPGIKLDRYTLNGIDPAAGTNIKTVGEILDMELPLNRDNPAVREDAEPEIIAAAQKSLSGQHLTKVLESNVIDRSDAEPFTLTEVLLNHWIYLSHFDRYKSVISVVNPANGDIYRLSMKNAFIFFLYAFNRSNDIILKKVPVVAAKRVRRIPLPTWDELRGLAQIKKVPNYYIDYILDTQIKIGTYVSIDAFREVCTEIQGVMLRHREMRHYNGDYVAEGQLHTIIDRCYMDIRIDLADEMDYDVWLNEVGIDVSSMGRLEFSLMAAAVLKTATGGDLGDTTTMRQIHAAMLRIMSAMSSYSVQYIAQINDSPIKIIDGKFPKLGIPEQHTESTYDIEIPNVTILDLRAYEKEHFNVRLPRPYVSMMVKEESIKIQVPTYLWTRLVSTGDVKAMMHVPLPVTALREPKVVDLSTMSQSGIAGYLPIPERDLGELVTTGYLVGYETLTDARRRAFLGI